LKLQLFVYKYKSDQLKVLGSSSDLFRSAHLGNST
jgi:hypothetical protein